MSLFKHILSLLCGEAEVFMSKESGKKKKKKEDASYRTWPSEDRHGKLSVYQKPKSCRQIEKDRPSLLVTNSLHVSLTKERRFKPMFSHLLESMIQKHLTY